jgi:lipopolysaccharide transport system permease protein
MLNTKSDEAWSLVIRPKGNPFSIDFRELYRYRDLVALFVKRDFTTVYKQTILGPLWFVIQPIFTTMIYVFIFGRLAGLSTDGIPQSLFYFAGTTMWSYFNNTMVNVSDTFVSNASLFGKIYFPRLTAPASKLISNLIPFGIQLATLAVLYAVEVARGATIAPTWLLAALPLLVLWLAAIALGTGMIVSALTTKYRDLRHLLGFGMQLWMYATPVVWPFSELPARLRWAAYINPVSAPIEAFRVALYGRGTLPAPMVWSSVGLTIFVLFLGLILFHKNESTFIDVA